VQPLRIRAARRALKSCLPSRSYAASQLDGPIGQSRRRHCIAAACVAPIGMACCCNETRAHQVATPFIAGDDPANLPLTFIAEVPCRFGIPAAGIRVGSVAVPNACNDPCERQSGDIRITIRALADLSICARFDARRATIEWTVRCPGICITVAMSTSRLDRAPEGSGVDLLGSVEKRRQPTHGRQGKRALPSGAPMWLVQLENSPSSPALSAGAFAIFFKEINALSASAPDSGICGHDAR
jgi:hypothetical protein